MTLQTEMNTPYDHQSAASSPECVICGDSSHGVHFGVNVCRACAAFFRRSTISNRTYLCRFGGGCEIGKDIRCSCRACRMDKCLKMGMDPSGVQRHRDQIGPRRARSPKVRKQQTRRRPANPPPTVHNLKSEVGVPPKGMDETAAEQSACSPTLNALNQQVGMDTSSQGPNSMFSSPICSPFSNLQLLGESLRKNIEEISNNYAAASSETKQCGPTYTTLTTANHSQGDQAGKNMANALMMENVLLTALRSASENSGGSVSSSGFCSASSFNSQLQSPCSPLSSLNTPAAIASCSRASPTAADWDRPSTSSAFKPVEELHQNLAAFAPKNGVKYVEPMDTPFINEMLRGYRRFVCLRKTASTLSTGGSLYRLFEDDSEEMVEGTYADNVISLKNDLSLVSDMINDHFPPLGSFSTDSKWALLRNFFCPFVMTERCYNSVKRFPDKGDTRFVISSRHFTDFKNLRSFFDVDSCKVDPNRMASIFKPTFGRLSSLLAQPMRQLNMSEEELVGLMGLFLWNDKAGGLAEEEVRLIDRTRESIHNELYYVCGRKAGGDPDTGVVRFGTICNLVHLAHRCAREVAGNFSLANVTNSFEIDTFLHSIHPHAW